MMKKIKYFYNKEHLDTENVRNIELYDYHPVLHYVMRGFQLVDNEPIVWWSYLVLTYGVVTGILSVTWCVFSIYHSVIIRDLPLITEAGVYLIIVLYQLIIIVFTKMDKREYYVILQMMREDFLLIQDKNKKYRDRFLSNQLIIWKIGLFLVLVPIVVTGLLFITAILWLLWFLATRDPNDDVKRPLVFPYWFPMFDVSETPYYEIAFAMTFILTMGVDVGWMFSLYIQLIWIGHVMTKADMAMWKMQDLMEGVYTTNSYERDVLIMRNRMSDVVADHASMYKLLDHYGNIQRKIFTYQEKVTGVLICVTAFSAAEKLDNGEINLNLITLCIASAVQIFIPCYVCTALCDKLTEVCEACYDIAIWEGVTPIRSYIILIMMRARRSSPLQSPGLTDMSRETFSKTISAAYSFFNMLRNFK